MHIDNKSVNKLKRHGAFSSSMWSFGPVGCSAGHIFVSFFFVSAFAFLTAKNFVAIALTERDSVWKMKQLNYEKSIY